MNAPRHFALIPAAGVGARMGAQGPKQYLQLAGKPMLRHVLETFTAIAAIDHVYVVVSAEDGYIASVIDDELAERVTVLRCGGATRQESVRNGLRQMRADEHDWVLVHDAARPGLAAALVERLLAALGEDEVGGLLALPVVDTLKRAGTDSRVQATVSREQLWAAQTPQMFRHGLLLRALQEVQGVTDEASAIEALGLQPRLIEGSARNFKVTLPQDVALAELYLQVKS